MNKAQIDQVKIHIEAYYALGLSNILAQQHYHISDLSNVQTVSYTHLDVYKRQKLARNF